MHVRVLIAQFLLPFCNFEMVNCDSYPSLQFFAEKKGKVYLAVPFLTVESRCWTDTSCGGRKEDPCILGYLVDR